MSETKHCRHVLAIHTLRLSVNLGVGDEERALAQPVDVDITFYYMQAPESTMFDDGTYLCYDILSQRLAGFVLNKPFKLIEFLAMSLYEETKAYLSGCIMEGDDVYIGLTLCKVEVPVEAIRNGTSYSYTDLPADVKVLTGIR